MVSSLLSKFSMNDKKDKILRKEKIYVTTKQLYAVRSELKSDIASINKRLDKHEQYFERIFAELAEIRKEMAEMRKEIRDTNVLTHRMLILMEEQNSRNIAVLDQYNLVVTKQDDHEVRIKLLEEKI